ncbi:MAG: universal stress protein [Myxococcales bacterium]|nr:universal stress protein [Myxococcales bacterium]
MRISRILVPVEYSESCLGALRLAADWATALGAGLEIIHVWDHPPHVPAEATVEHPPGVKQSLLTLIAENAAREMREFVAKANLPPSLAVSEHLESGDPAAAILVAVERHHADLVVISTHARRGFRHFLLGSVAERVVRLSPVPVLTVPATVPVSGT